MMENAVLQAIADRRSIRGYTEEKLTAEETKILMDVAMQSPSARNSQPWHFTFCTDQALIQKVNEASYTAMGREPFDIFYAAPLVIFISANDDGFFNKLDCGIAVENLALAAHSMGLGSVILGLPRAGFESEMGKELGKALQFPEGHQFMIAISIGHPDRTKPAHPWLENRISVVE